MSKHLRQILISILLAPVIGVGIILIPQEIFSVNLGDQILWFCIVVELFTLLYAYVMDRCFGDPNDYHPIVGFGRMIGWGEKRFNRGDHRRCSGLLYNGSLVLFVFTVFTLFDVLLRYATQMFRDVPAAKMSVGVFTVCFSIGWAFFMLSGTTLVREVEGVFAALRESLPKGRKQVARIVGRDTEALSEQEVRTAALETLSENLSDGVVAPMFWWAVLGLPGMVAYKMINTQDSMVGYKNERYREYGWFSAKLDDVVNLIPARLTAILMIASVWRWDLLRFVARNGRKHASPNSGYPEAALAGILACRFGGSHDYFGETVYKPFIGEQDRPIVDEDVAIAVRVNRRAEVLMLVIAMIIRSAILIAFCSLV